MKRVIGVSLAATALAAGLTACSGTAHLQEAAGQTSAPTASPSPSASPSSSATSGQVRDVAVNLPATPELRAELLRAYVAARPDVRSQEVSGPDKGSLYYAYDTRTSTYWAIAWFHPSPQARYQTQVNFQDGMGGGVFIRTVGHRWRAIVHERANLPCPGDVPAAVLRAWRLRAQSCTT